MQIFAKQVLWELASGLVTAIILGLFMPSPVQAALVTFNFEGDIFEASDLPELAGKSIKGSFAVNPTDRLPSDPTVGAYAVSTLSIVLVGHTYVLSPTGQAEVVIRHDPNDPLRNDFSLSSWGTTPLEPALSGQAINGYVPVDFSFIGNFPESPKSDSLQPFTIADAFMRFGDLRTQTILVEAFVFNDTTLSPVPLPTTFLLFGMGLMGLIGLATKSYLWQR